jgi:hypothetical protein
VRFNIFVEGFVERKIDVNLILVLYIIKFCALLFENVITQSKSRGDDGGRSGTASRRSTYPSPLIYFC